MKAEKLLAAYAAGKRDFRNAYLRGADLSNAYLSNADLRDADLSSADLSNAYLSNADLSNANLRDADLSGADLRGVKEVFHLGQPDGWFVWSYLNGKQQRICVGCRDFTLKEGREYWANKPDRREVLAALDYAEVIARIRGWATEGK